MRKSIKTLLMLLLIPVIITYCSPLPKKKGPNWEKIASLEGAGHFKITLSSSKKKYKIGEEISFTITSDKDGYLWLGYVSPQDKISVIYPLEQGAEHKIPADQPMQIPPQDSDWKIKATPPAGSLLIFAVVAEKDVPLRYLIPFISTEKEIKLHNKDINVGGRTKWDIATLVIKIEEDKK